MQAHVRKQAWQRFGQWFSSATISQIDRLEGRLKLNPHALNTVIYQLADVDINEYGIHLMQSLAQGMAQVH